MRKNTAHSSAIKYMIVSVYYNLGLVSENISISALKKLYGTRNTSRFARLTGLLWKNKMNVTGVNIPQTVRCKYILTYSLQTDGERRENLHFQQ